MRVINCTLIIILSLVAFSPLSAFAQTLRINFIDVGEGDAALIQTPGGRNILIDTGNLKSGATTAKYLKDKGVKTIDYLIFTGARLNHIGGSFFVLQGFDIKNVYDNGLQLIEPIDFSDIYRWYSLLVRENPRYSALKSGDIIFADDVTLRVVWPENVDLFSDLNSSSLAIILEYGDFRCLFMGDLTSVTEKEIIRKTNVKADLLKLAYNSGVDTNCDEFLKAVAPKIVVISINNDNFYGYPNTEVLDRLNSANIELYRTDRSGDIVFTITPANYKEVHVKTGKTTPKD